MVELVLTATEAKTALLRDLMQGSSVSSRLATGTGTDGVVIVCDGSDGTSCLLNGGKHFKLGELAAQAVSQATAEALFRADRPVPGISAQPAAPAAAVWHYRSKPSGPVPGPAARGRNRL